MHPVVRPILATLTVALLAACGPSGTGTEATVAPPAAAPADRMDPVPAAGTAAPAVAGDGDGQGDALVAGTRYHATAQVRCTGYRDAAAGLCEAGVVRGTETGTFVDVRLPGGATRTLFFNADGSFLAFATAEADGTAAMASASRREGDVTVATLGTERYEIPDAFVLGD